MHVLIVGSVQVGKSTLIQKLLKELNRPVCGYKTKKEEGLKAEDGGVPIYIYRANGPYEQTPENLVGISKDFRLQVNAEAFDRFASVLREPVPEGSILLMDEIGHMESKSQAFCSAVLSVLDGDVPVIAAVKNKDKPFLETVRNHPKCRCFYITEDNRDILYEEILDFFRLQDKFNVQ